MIKLFGWLTSLSAFIVGVFRSVKTWVVGAVAYQGAKGAFHVSTVLMFFIVLQGITWLISIGISIALLFYGSDLIYSVLDITGISAKLRSLVSGISGAFGGSISIGFGETANVGGIDSFFGFSNFLNLAISILVGFLLLKINIFVYRASLRGFTRLPSITRYMGGPN